MLSFTTIVLFVVVVTVIGGFILVFTALSAPERPGAQKKCPSCGHGSDRDAKFCGHCGARLT